MNNNTLEPAPHMIGKRIIETTKGKFFSIKYHNKKGETNTYTVRTGVKKGTKGGTNNCPPEAVTLYIVAKNGKVDEPHFGMFYLDRILDNSILPNR
jgi:hypothetical protein